MNKPQNKKQVKNNKHTTRMIVIIVLAVFALAAIIATAVFMVNNHKRKVRPIKPSEQDITVVAEVTGSTGEKYELYYEELRFVTMLYKTSIAKENGYASAEYAWSDPEFVEAHRAELEEVVFSNLANNYAIIDLCKYYGIDVESEEVDDAVQKQLEELVEKDFKGDFNKYLEWIEENSMSDHYMRFACRVNYLESAAYYALSDNKQFIQFDESDYKKFIDYVLTSGEYCRTLSVLCDNAKDAQEIYDNVSVITDPEKRLATFKTWIGSSKNKDFQLTTVNGYYFTHGEMGTAYENAAFALKSGEVSKPVETASGYYVIMRLDPEEKYVNNNWETLLKYYQAAVLGKVEDSFKAGLVCELNQNGKSYDLVNIK